MSDQSNNSTPPTNGNTNSDTNSNGALIKRHFGPNGNGARGDSPAAPGKYGWLGEARCSELVVAHNDRGSPISEEYRAIRTGLLAACPEGRFAYVVTSAEPGEGKTITSLNLAMVLTERRDSTTILVDGNLRNGHMTRLVRVPSQPGLAELLADEASLDQVTQPTAYPNLFYIPNGGAVDTSAGQFLGPQLRSVMAELRRRYDHVLIDSPAIHSAPDAGIVGAVEAEALLVVRMYRTRRESVAKAVRILNGANVKVAGIILNERKFFIPKAVYQSL